MPHPHVQEHIELIARHEAEFLARRTPAERRIDAIAAFIGSVGFVLVHLCIFALWIGWNCFPRVHHFDAKPFSLLQTCVAMEALLAASFILMRQTRLARRSEEREQLILQIMLLTEKEVTAVLNLDRQVAQQIGLERAANVPEIRELAQETPLEEVAKTIKETLLEIEASDESTAPATVNVSGSEGEAR